MWTKGSRGLSETWCFLCDLQATGTDLVVISEARGRHGLPPLGTCEWAPPAALVTSGVSKKKRALQPSKTPLGTHPPCCCHCQKLWEVLRCLITVHSQNLQLGAACTATPVWAKWDEVFLAWSIGIREKPPQLSLTPEVDMATTTRGP